MLDNIQNSSFVVGMKQTTKMIEEEKATLVFIANDANEHIIDKIKVVCEKHSVKVIYVDTMDELGNACGISRNAATACIIK